MRRKALDAFIAKKIEIDTMLARLKSLSDDHFNADPEQVTWAGGRIFSIARVD